MKAKTPELHPQTAGGYECIWCDSIFERKTEESVLQCPHCGNKNARDMVPIYVDDDPEETMMYTEKDFQGGD